MSKKVISIVGATGAQGRSVVDALLKSEGYAIRAITRRTESNASQELRSLGVEVVGADANDVQSLVAAFQGSSIIFALTDFFEPFGKNGPQKAIEIESQQGINLARAAADTKTLEHYIWSTLPDARSISGGKFVIPHFEAKNMVDRYIRSTPDLLPKTTFLWVTFYAANYTFPMFTPYEIPTAGKYIQIQNTPADILIKTIGDVKKNLGPFVKAIVEQPNKTLAGKIVLAHVEDTTAGEMLQTWANAQGKVAQYVQVDDETFNNIWPMWAEEMAVMLRFWEWAREKSWTSEFGDVVTKDDLGVGGLGTLKEAFAALKM
jgi:NmrA-like family